MSKKAWLAIAVAIFIPLVFYMIARRYGVNMPPRYLYDSVTTRIEDGKEFNDTLWHRAKDFTLQDQLGETVTLNGQAGKVVVINFFFTHCASICPIMTRNIKKLQDGLKFQEGGKRIDTSFVRFLSLSVDPVRDSAPVLRKYADHYGVNSDVWWMLTGPKKTIYDFALNELRLGLVDSGTVDSNFIHTDLLTLLDRDHVVRGYYDGTDTAALAKLADDIVYIMLERDKNKKSVFVTQLKPMMIPVGIVLLGTLLAVIYFSTRKKEIF